MTTKAEVNKRHDELESRLREVLTDGAAGRPLPSVPDILKLLGRCHGTIQFLREGR